MEDFDNDIRPPELSPWAISLLKGEKSSLKAEVSPLNQHNTITSTNTNTNSCFTRHNQQNELTSSKSTRFFKSLNLGQASRLNDNGLFESKRSISSSSTLKRKSSLLTPQKGNKSPLHKISNKSSMLDIEDSGSPEIGRKLHHARSPFRDMKAEEIWNDNNNHNKENKDIFSLDFSKSNRNDLFSLEVDQSNDNLALIKKQREQINLLQNQINSSNETIDINSKSYSILEQIGKGGSSKVYKASISNKIVAVKIVKFDSDDNENIESIKELKGEIQILKKLKLCSRAIQLIDYEISNSVFKIAMECGEIDLAHVIQSRFKVHGFDEQFVRFHVNEIVQCIKAVHDLGIVHSDLKPANFLFVKGSLKLIDFGISNSINGTATVNVYRECQMGTPNYMAPETLIEISNDSNSIWKIGKPSDIWSIGCITYQLTYGHPPYHQYMGTKKILAITNPKIQISYPTYDSNNNNHIPDSLIQFMKRCLNRNPQLRSQCDDLLSSSFLKPICLSRGILRDIVKWSVVYGGRHPEIAKGLSGVSKEEELDDLQKKSVIKLDTLVENLIKKVNQR